MIFSVNKPKGMTSHDVVDHVRKILKERWVGHGGTLDPLAHGVLVIGVGKESVRKLNSCLHGEKEYIATLKLGYESETDDEEGSKVHISDKAISEEAVNSVLGSFIGEIDQVPPKYSAVKIKGVPAYKLARRGVEFELKPRKVFIKKIELVSFEYPKVILKIECGSGVYIRALARDIGRALSTGAYLEDLQRTRVGNFNIEDSVSLERINELNVQ